MKPAPIATLLPPEFDSFQFACRERGGADDAIAINEHEVLNHAEQRNSCSRVLFIYYSSAFGTIIPCKLCDKLFTQLDFPLGICNWI